MNRFIRTSDVKTVRLRIMMISKPKTVENDSWMCLTTLHSAYTLTIANKGTDSREPHKNCIYYIADHLHFNNNVSIRVKGTKYTSAT